MNSIRKNLKITGRLTTIFGIIGIACGILALIVGVIVFLIPQDVLKPDAEGFEGLGTAIFKVLFLIIGLAGIVFSILSIMFVPIGIKIARLRKCEDSELKCKVGKLRSYITPYIIIAVIFLLVIILLSISSSSDEIAAIVIADCFLGLCVAGAVFFVTFILITANKLQKCEISSDVEVVEETISE